MALATLSIDLVAKLAQFEADMGKAARASEKTANQIAGAFGLIKSAAGGLAAGIGVGGLVAFTRSTIDALDALNDVKDATGASIENISALEDVAGRTGTTLDVVTGSLIKLNQTLSAAKEGSPQAAALQAIGLSAEELRRLDPAEALRQTAVALAGFADDGNKARLVQELFGKSLREVAPFLGDLAKQTELVAKVTAEQVAEAEKFNLQLFEMQKNLQDVSRSLVGPIITGMNGLIEKFREGQKAGEGFIVTLLRQTEIARLLGLAEAKLKNTGGATGTWESAENMRAQARLLRQGKLSVDFDGATKGGTPKAGSTRGKTPDGISAVTTELDRYLASLEQILEREQDLSAVQTAQLRISQAGANGFSEAQRARILELATQIDKNKELVEVERQRNELSRAFALEAGDRVAAENAAYRDRLKQLTDNTPSEVFKRQQADLELLQRAYAATDITAQQYIESVRELYNINDERIEKSKSLAEELGLSFTSAFEDAIVGGKGLRGALKGLEQDILRIVTRKLVTEPLGNALSGAIGGGGGGGGIGGFFSGIFGKLFSADGGGFTGTGPRSGGLDGRGGFLGVLHPNETVIDHTRGRSSGATQQYITINPPAGMSRQASSQFAADAARQLRMADLRNN